MVVSVSGMMVAGVESVVSKEGAVVCFEEIAGSRLSDMLRAWKIQS